MVETGIKRSSGYGYGREFDLPFAEAAERAREALKGEGFGVLCEIDIREKMREKLGVDFTNYVILGACNPQLAYEGLKSEKELGLLLPCNVVVYEDNCKSVVSAIDARKMMSVVGNRDLEAVAELVNEKLRRAVDGISAK